ncbi:MAG: hypothetical protein R3B57_00850 [Phycisphaerales bacterium]
MTRVPKRAFSVTPGRAVLVLVGGVLVASQAGCYKRVTRAEGLGSDQLAPKIAQPQTTFTQDLGAAVMGDKKKKKHK